MRTSRHPVTALAAIRSFVLIALSLLLAGQQVLKPTPEIPTRRLVRIKTLILELLDTDRAALVDWLKRRGFI
jgi:hypothetical protein